MVSFSLHANGAVLESLKVLDTPPRKKILLLLDELEKIKCLLETSGKLGSIVFQQEPN
jgi:hypothetical protein